MGEEKEQDRPNEFVIISANPKSGSRNRLTLVAELKKSIEQAGYDCELHNDLSQMESRAQDLANEGRLRTVVAAGGDGTASMVASLIPTHIPITLFPIGSENLLAKFFSIVAESEHCVKSIQRLRTKSIDVMTANGNLCLLMASVGFDAEVVRQVHQSRKSHITRWSYWTAILSTLARYRWPNLKIVIRDENDHVMEETKGSWVFIFNVPRYAAGLAIIEDAIENDGMLDIGIFDCGGLLNGLWCYWAVARGKHHQLKQWRRFRCRSISIESTNDFGKDNQPSCQTDGDWACDLPVIIQLTDRKLEIVF